jgi:hypothetical protein
LNYNIMMRILCNGTCPFLGNNCWTVAVRHVKYYIKANMNIPANYAWNVTGHITIEN